MACLDPWLTSPTQTNLALLGQVSQNRSPKQASKSSLAQALRNTRPPHQTSILIHFLTQRGEASSGARIKRGPYISREDCIINLTLRDTVMLPRHTGWLLFGSFRRPAWFVIRPTSSDPTGITEIRFTYSDPTTLSNATHELFLGTRACHMSNIVEGTHKSSYGKMMEIDQKRESICECYTWKAKWAGHSATNPSYYSVLS
jgi:hypothetical protein